MYTPIFAQARRDARTVYAGTMLLLTLAVCALVHQLMGHPLLGESARRYAKPLTPFVLIALGLYILSDIDAGELLGR